jgi:hypothetical protein
MLYHILSFDRASRIAKGVNPVLFNEKEETINNEAYVVSLYSSYPLVINRTYSFNPCHKFIHNEYILGIANNDRPF